MEITTIGLDLTKSIFQVHGIDASGQVVVRKSLRRAQMLPFFARLPPATSRHWPHNNNDTRLAEEEIGFTRLRERCDVMANRSDREQGQPTERPRHHSLRSRTRPCSWTPSWPAVSIDCVNRPDRRLHLTNATTSIYLLHRGGHPQRTFVVQNYCSVN
jgi:hypothetical protein